MLALCALPTDDTDTATCNRLHTDTTSDQLKHCDMDYKLYFVNGSEH